MLEELLIEHRGKRYVGHVRAAPGRPLMASFPAYHWHFAHRDHLVAEFPATPLDTPDAVRARLVRILARIEASGDGQSERRLAGRHAVRRQRDG